MTTNPWVQLRRLCDPSRPASREEQTRRAAAYDPTDTIVRKLAMDPERPVHIALTGTVGTGKSSELAMIADRALAERSVVHFDLFGHLVNAVKDPSALDLLAPWEVLALVGLALSRAAEALPVEAERQRLAGAIEQLRPKDPNVPTLDVGRLAGAVAVGVGLYAAGAPAAALTFVKPLADAASWRLPLGRSPQRDDQDGDVRRLLDAVNALILGMQKVYVRPTLVVVDGLDRLVQADAVERLFVRSSLLAELACNLVVTAPLVLQRRFLANLRGFERVEVRNVPVLDRDHPLQPTEHVRFFHELAAKRVARVDAAWRPLSDVQLTRLAWASGGRARDFVELLVLVCEAAFDAETRVASDAHVEQAVDLLRRKREEGLTRKQVGVLRAVMDDPQHLLPDDDPVALDAVEQHKLLPYPNQSTWYHPHPLLLLHQLR